MKMRLLVVEDDRLIASHIAAGLSAKGYGVDRAECGEDALHALARQDYAGVVLDRMLPDISGIELLERVRRSGKRPPVVMLSALGTVKDRIEGLEAGADDYLTKPFDIEELIARLNAVSRRVGAMETAQDPMGDAGIMVGRLNLDPSGHSASFGTREIELNRRQYSLLAHLMRHADRLVTRSMLLEHVWGYSFAPATNIVESNMCRLRDRLHELGCDPVDTLRGAGYILRSERCA